MLADLMLGHFHDEYVVLPNRGAHVVVLPSGPTNVGVILIAGGNVHSSPPWSTNLPLSSKPFVLVREERERMGAESALDCRRERLWKVQTAMSWLLEMRKAKRSSCQEAAGILAVKEAGGRKQGQSERSACKEVDGHSKQ
jgi:hypothetical protein